MMKAAKIRSFYVKKEIAPYLDRVLKRDEIRVIRKTEKESGYEYELLLSGNKFHLAIKDAYCEKESDCYGGVPVYSIDTIQDFGKLQRLIKLNGRSNYFVLSTDLKKYDQLLRSI